MSGTLIAPSQVGFLVWLGSAFSTSSVVIPFNNVTYNIGSCFNTSTYKFTTPISGYYLFTVNGCSASTTYIEINIFENSSSILNVRGSAPSGNTTNAGCG